MHRRTVVMPTGVLDNSLEALLLSPSTYWGVVRLDIPEWAVTGLEVQTTSPENLRVALETMRSVCLLFSVETALFNCSNTDLAQRLMAVGFKHHKGYSLVHAVNQLEGAKPW